MIKPNSLRWLHIATVLAGVCLTGAPMPAEAQSRPGRDRNRNQEVDPVQQQLDAAMREEVAQILSPAGGALTPAGFSASLVRAEALLNQAAWYVDASNTDLFKEVARATRLLRLMVEGRQTGNPELWAMLMDHPELASAVAFGLEPGRDNLPEAMLILDSLRKQFGAEKLAEYANLTVAIAAVHDQARTPPGRQPTTAGSPKELWAYFVRYENRMVFGIKGMPVDLLAHVVDTTASIEEMQWALDRYGKDAQVGNRYAEIMYDDNAMATGAPKRIDSEQYTLPNIRRVGGVCAEQAYFAAHIGKSMGVPTIELSSVGATMSHAWLGYLRVRGRQAAWDFDTGCYDEYKQYVGAFRDPLSGDRMDEGHAAFLSLMVGADDQAIYSALAMRDAATSLARNSAEADSPKLTVEVESATAVDPKRVPDAPGINSLVTAAFTQTGAERRIWQLTGELASEQRIGAAEVQATLGALEKICGRNEIGYFALMAPQLLWAVEDTRAQSQLYDRVARAVRQKPGYEANVRFAQGDGLRRREMYAQAMDVYLMPTKSRNLDGPWTVTAVDRIGALLRTTNKQQHLPDVLEGIFKRIPRPSTEGSHSARRGSVWGQVGERYYLALVASGRHKEAEDLRRQLNTIVRNVEIPIRRR